MSSKEPCMCEIRRMANPDLPRKPCTCAGTPPEWQLSEGDAKKCIELIYQRHRLNG